MTSLSRGARASKRLWPGGRTEHLRPNVREQPAVAQNCHAKQAAIIVPARALPDITGNMPTYPDIPNDLFRTRGRACGAADPTRSRPSTAALTSDGARNASEIVMLTWRGLQSSRTAIWVMLLTAPVSI
jgi:hypothetical protein